MNNTIHIESGKELKLENVASFRKKIKKSSVNSEFCRIINLLENNGATVIGPIVTATFGVEIINDELVLDIEFLVSVDKKIELPDAAYVFKPVFYLVNALHVRYEGAPSEIEHVYKEIVSYMNQNQLHQVSPAYNVNSNHQMNVNEMGKSSIIDIYVGVKPSIL